jgi:3-hydroxybutyrate dehydrogenase
VRQRQEPAMTPDLSAKTALVTGSTSGIGMALAEALAAQGANLVINGLGDPGKIESERSRLEGQYGVKVRYDGANMLAPGEIAAMIENTGPIDILVNNAGIQHVAPVDEFPIEQWDRIIAINLSSAFHATRAALPQMKARGWGRIVNIASAHGLVASPFKSAYVAAKHGVLGLTKTVALEVATLGITCNAICPGYVLTDLVAAQIKDQSKARGISEEAVMKDVILAAQPTKAFVTFEQLSGLLLYLVSDAGASANGAAISVDGGWTAQ